MVNAPDTSSVNCTGILIEARKRVTFVDVGTEKGAASTADFAIDVPMNINIALQCHQFLMSLGGLHSGQDMCLHDQEVTNIFSTQ